MKQNMQLQWFISRLVLVGLLLDHEVSIRIVVELSLQVVGELHTGE